MTVIRCLAFVLVAALAGCKQKSKSPAAPTADAAPVTTAVPVPLLADAAVFGAAIRARMGDGNEPPADLPMAASVLKFRNIDGVPEYRLVIATAGRGGCGDEPDRKSGPLAPGEALFDASVTSVAPGRLTLAETAGMTGFATINAHKLVIDSPAKNTEIIVTASGADFVAGSVHAGNESKGPFMGGSFVAVICPPPAP